MRVRCSFNSTLAVCLAGILLSSAALAQPPQGGRGGQRGGFGGFGGFGGGPGFGGPLLDRATLLGSRQVREHLKIEDAQEATIEAALEAYRDERRSARPDFQGFRDMSDEERVQMMEKMRKDAETLSRKTDETLGAFLEPEQLKRLDQIALQAKLNGRQMVATLKADELKSKLQITEEQIAKMTAVEEQFQEKQRAMGERLRGSFSPDGDREAMREQFEKMREEGEKLNSEMRKEALAVLTSEQTEQLNEMKGQAFELDMRSLMGGRGPGGPGGFGGPGGRRDGEGRDGGGRGRGRDGGNRPASDDSI